MKEGEGLVKVVTLHKYTETHLHKVWSPNLSLQLTSLQSLGNIHISDLELSILGDKGIGRLQVSMANSMLMKTLQGLQALNEVSPNDIFFNVLSSSLISLYLLHQVAAAAVLHHNAQLSIVIGQKRLEETHDILVADRGKKSNLIQCISNFPFGHLVDLYTLECISLSIRFTIYLEDGS